MTDMLLPEGWVEVSLGDICFRSQYGYTTKATNEGYVKYLRTTDITKKDLNWSSVPYCETIPEDILKYQLYHNDIVISRAGSIGFSCLLSYPPNNAIFASYLIRFRPLVSICAQYLKWYLETPFYWQQLYVKSVGNALQNVNASKLSDIIVFLPPIAEQEEIAQRVDRAIGHVDELKSRFETLLTTLKTFRQSVLNAAVTGKLINNPIIKYKSLITCVDVHNGKRKPVSLEIRRNIQGDIPYYGATGIVDYLNDFTHNGRYLLVGEDGANLLTKSKELAYIVQGKIWVNNHAHVLKEKKCMSLDFIKIVINSLELKAWVTGSAQPKLTKKSLESLPIPDFSLAEQEEIVKRVEAYFALADQIEKQVQSALDKVNLLTQSILAKAFRGELTKEWRQKNPELISGENSAEALLKRIKAEKEALEKSSKKTPRSKVKIL